MWLAPSHLGESHRRPFPALPGMFDTTTWNKLNDSCSLLQSLTVYVHLPTHTDTQSWSNLPWRCLHVIPSRFSWCARLSAVSRMFEKITTRPEAEKTTSSWRNKRCIIRTSRRSENNPSCHPNIVKTLRKHLDMTDGCSWCSWVWKPMQPKFLSSGPKLFASLLGRWSHVEVARSGRPSNEQALALVPKGSLDFGHEIG